MLKDILKNLIGWHTSRKLVVISVDDYGNVRNSSKKSVDTMISKGYHARSVFDSLDALETPDDLTALFDVLTSVQDRYGRHACFTPFALSANVDFERVIQGGFEKYFYEPLTRTYERLDESATLRLIREGIQKRIFLPEFHGREHLNIPIFESLLQQRNDSLLLSLSNHAVSFIHAADPTHQQYTLAFLDQSLSGLERLPLIESGTQLFEAVYGYRPTNFMAPGATYRRELNAELTKAGIRYIDSAMITEKREMVYLGKGIAKRSVYVVRNAVFEPAQDGVSSVGGAMKQIEAAFLCRRPAIISSHRVNFSGRISEVNRHQGLTCLRDLLKKIVSRWPDVEFVSARELGDMMTKDSQS